MAGAAAAKGLTGLAQTLIGRKQRNQALDALSRLDDPQMTMPEGIEEMIHLARTRAGMPMPGMDVARGELGARTSRGVDAVSRAARTPGEIMAATQDLYAEEMRNVRQLEVDGDNYQAAREGELMNALATKGNVEQRMFQVNEMMPFERKYNQYMQDAQIGGQNIAGGIGAMGGALGDFMSNYARVKMLQGWMDPGETAAAEDPEDQYPQWIRSALSKITQQGLG